MWLSHLARLRRLSHKTAMSSPSSSLLLPPRGGSIVSWCGCGKSRDWFSTKRTGERKTPQIGIGKGFAPAACLSKGRYAYENVWLLLLVVAPVAAPAQNPSPLRPWRYELI